MGTIHPEAQRAHFDQYPDHKDIVKPFLTCFDVTRGFVRQRGTDRIACFFLKPDHFIAEQIGLERELLLCYAPFAEFQARTLRMVDVVLDEDRLRLDPIGAILISDDPETQKIVSQYLTAEPERPPIAALSSAQVSNLHQANDIRTLFYEQFFTRDLFGLESPLRTDTTFFGRTNTVSELLDRFRGGQNSGLFGLRRIGKTSVLYALQRRIRGSQLGGVAYLDLSNPARYQARWWVLLQEIVRNFAQPLELERGQRSKVRALNIDYTESDAARHAHADLDYLQTLYAGNKLLLMLDEIENITYKISPSPSWETDFLPFWQTLRSIHQDTEGAFSFLLAGVNPYIIEVDRIGAFDNPLFSTVKSFFVQPFDKGTLRDMVLKIGRFMGLQFDEALFDRFHSEYGGHPFLARQACSLLVKTLKQRPGNVDSALFARERNKVALALDRNVRQILNVLAIWYPEEYELLGELAKGRVSDFVEFARSSASFTQHVEGYGLVRDARDKPEIVIGLVREHLAGVDFPKRHFARIGEREEILAEISRRRNRIEERLRRVLHDGLRFASGKKAASQALDALKPDRRAIIAQYSYEEMWSALYFNELIDVIKKHWSVFQNYFSENQEKVVQWLEQINICRADAHAKTLSEEDLTFLRVCFRRIEEVLELDVGGNA